MSEDAPTTFHGPTLAREALRRIAEADRAHSVALSRNGASVFYHLNGEVLSGDRAAGHAAHLRESAAVLAQLANVAAMVGPTHMERSGPGDLKWDDALASVAEVVPKTATTV